MRKKYLLAAIAAGMVLPIGAAYADEASNLKTEAKTLQQQNDALAKRLAALEKRQKASDADAMQRVMNARAADMPMPVKARPAAPVSDALCWNSVCLYGIIDAGFGWQSHGMPFNGQASYGSQYLASTGSNRALWTMAPNAMSQSMIGMKGQYEILPDLNAIFKVEAGFDPMSAQLTNGNGSLAQQNGIPLQYRSANGDSSRNGQAFSGQAYVGLSSQTWGTLTIGRNNSLMADQILGYDAMGGSYAFDPMGFSGTWIGGGSTEDGRVDQSIKYTWNNGLVHAGALYQVGNYGGSDTTDWVHDNLQGDIGVNYGGFSVDGTAAKITGMVSAATLAFTGATPTSTLGSQSLAATISDNVEWMVTAKYKWDRFQVMGGYEHIDFANPSDPVPTTGFTSNYGYFFSSVNNTAYSYHDKVLQMMWIGGQWKATDQLTLLASYYHETQNSFGATSCNTTFAATCSGTMDAVSLVADYVFTKHFDVYAGVMYSQISNGLASGSVQTSVFNSAGVYAGSNGKSTASNIDPTVGARYSF